MEDGQKRVSVTRYRHDEEAPSMWSERDGDHTDGDGYTDQVYGM